MPRITPFSEDALAEALSNKFTSTDHIKTKQHFRYLNKYLKDPAVDARRIVIEEGYVSKDFLHDYASYYSLCFEGYEKVCRRVHFFAVDFTEQEFIQMIEGRPTRQDIAGSYLGFIVVKPIPYTIIGFTLLKVYSNDPTGRHFWGIKTYTVHLYGKRLTIDSLAFQEQDSVLAACATTAIWSMLNKAADSRLCLLKSPNEITRDSGVLSTDGSRLFPNKGLDIRQICHAIYQSGLATEVIQPDSVLTHPTHGRARPDLFQKVVSKTYLKQILNAYSAIGIPIILVIGVPLDNNFYGLHAITVSGFKLPGPTSVRPNLYITYYADSMEKFYAHDDQWGPFVRVEWENDFELNTEWNIGDRRTYVHQIVIPTFPKIRISYDDIKILVVGLDRILTTTFRTNTVFDLVWDIKIELSETYKELVSQLDPDMFPNKAQHLMKQLPKYVWIATCYIGQNKALIVVFDATGLSKAMLGVDLLSLLPQDINQAIVKFLETNIRNTTIVNAFQHNASDQYYQFLIDGLKE